MRRLDMLLKRAWSLYSARNFNGAVACFSEAIALNLGCTDAYRGRGTTYLGIGEYAAAIEDFTTAIELAPNRPYLFASRSLAHYAAGQMAEAISDCDAAVRLGDVLPADSLARVYYTRGMAWRALGDIKRSEASLAKAREFDVEGRCPPTGG